MKVVEPKVYLVAETVVCTHLGEYLRDISAGDWVHQNDSRSDHDLLTEAAGRLCYRSFAPGLNPNVTKVREGNKPYVENILKSRHGSVLEHASVTFIFHHVSRVLTHELVRHRAGTAVSQESMRYVRLDEIPFWFPPGVEFDWEMRSRAVVLLGAIEQFQLYMTKKFGLDDEKTSFTVKKLLTSIMRRFAPQGVATSIMWTANMRALRHCLELRTDPSAEEEIRMVFDQVGTIVSQRYPSIFQDFRRMDNGAWLPLYSKV